MLELAVVLVIVTAVTTLAVSTFSSYRSRSAARGAAQLFSRDLSLARSSARRGREAVVIRFFEDARWYSVQTASGRELVRRRFAGDGDFTLSAIDLELTGDSLSFDAAGAADLESTTGSAAFRAGSTTWAVTFNALGAARLAER
jgi:Tfp pilus assembly protein FimT